MYFLAFLNSFMPISGEVFTTEGTLNKAGKYISFICSGVCFQGSGFFNLIKLFFADMSVTEIVTSVHVTVVYRTFKHVMQSSLRRGIRTVFCQNIIHCIAFGIDRKIM